jgi:hypothetical protein
MLAPMDIPGAAAGTATVPWLVLGLVVGAALVLLAGLTTAVALRRSRRAGAPEDLDGPQDDLPGFLEAPPGSAAAPAPREGWAALAPPPPAAPTGPPRRRDTLVVLAAMGATALLLVGAAAVVAAAARPDDRRPHADRSRPAEARLTFGGLVLEPRAVGVTATYPVVEVTAEDGRARAQVEFPTFNCLSAEAPADPVAAGCTRSVTESAELASPDLVVQGDGAGLRIAGRFPTEVRPNGGPPTATGRVYELRITVVPTAGGTGGGWRPAEGELELGAERAATVDEPGANLLRFR